MYVSSKRACEVFDVSANSLRRWQEEGKIVAKVLPSGHRRYLVGAETQNQREQACKRIAYCRVSSSKQKEDLERQRQFLSHKYPQHEVVSDIGSGIHFHRPKLLSVLGQSMAGRVSEVVVASKDRLCRFAFELVAWIFETHGTRLVVLDQADKSPEVEFSEDVLAIMQVFACRWNGRRRYADRQPNTQDQDLPDPPTEGQAREDGGCGQVHVQ